MGRFLALDYGSKRIGVAVSDPLRITAQPVAVISSLNELSQIIEKYLPVELLLVGLPKNLKGEIGPAGEKTLKFIEQLKARFSLPVETWDERMTTKASERVLIDAGLSRAKRKQVIDKSAAVLILQGYLDLNSKS